MTSSNETHGQTFTVTASGHSGTIANPNNFYVGDFPPAQQPHFGGWNQPAFQFAPVPMWTWTTGSGTFPKTAHATTDPTIVNHCPFCGSGALTGRSDGGVDCGVCNETFRVSRQPLYSNEPSPESGAGVESFDNDPLTDEDPFEAPGGAPAPGEQDPSAVPPEEDPAAEDGGGSDEEQPLPDFMSRLRSKSGVLLSPEDFLLHHAIRSSRGE